MSVHVCDCDHNGRKEHHIRYPGMTKEAAQELADWINADGRQQQLKTQVATLEKQLQAARDAHNRLQAEITRVLIAAEQHSQVHGYFLPTEVRTMLYSPRHEI